MEFRRIKHDSVEISNAEEYGNIELYINTCQAIIKIADTISNTMYKRYPDKLRFDRNALHQTMGGRRGGGNFKESNKKRKSIKRKSIKRKSLRKKSTRRRKSKKSKR